MRDHRQHPRKVLNFTVGYQLDGGPRMEAICRDISLGGMYIEAAASAPFGASLNVYLPLPGMHDAAIRATVRWTKPDGMGLQFGVMGARETHALTKLLGTL